MNPKHPGSQRRPEAKALVLESPHGFSPLDVLLGALGTAVLHVILVLLLKISIRFFP